jgi:hypothetical protein
MVCHIIDANGCTFILPITIAADPLPICFCSESMFRFRNVYNTATNTTTPAAGIVVLSRTASTMVPNGNTFTVTAAGDYVIRMKDGNGCIAISNTVTVNPIIISAKLDKNITCFFTSCCLH